MRRWPLALVALLLAGCTSGNDHPTPTPTITATQTVTHVRSPSTAPVVAGPTTSKNATCPFVATQTAADDIGMRIARSTVQTSGGKAVGCEFFPQTHPTAQCGATCLNGEHLPADPKQPVLKLLITQYPSAPAAHNAMVRAADAGTHAQQWTIGASKGLAFQTDFYPADKGTDWAVAFTRATRLVRVDTVVTSGALSAVSAARHIAEKIRS